MHTIRRTTRRESPHRIHSAGKYRPIMIELSPPFDTIGVRLKQTRRVYRMPVDWLYREAVRAAIALEKAEKIKARKAARAKA